MSVATADPLQRLLPLLAEEQGRITACHAGLRFRSAFQPIYSLSHGRVVGHEALLRATDRAGRPVAPPEVFRTGGDFAELMRRDRIARLVHLGNYADGPRAQWLFVNVHPQVFAHGFGPDSDDFVRRSHEYFGLPGHRVVIEVMEESVRDDSDFDTAVQRARASGCLIALDDFGAGHSNFDRVWRLRPEIVKLDRSLVLRAARDRSARRIVVQMVSLLHECGALVLMEGVETEAEAIVALEADADLVQGYLFGVPQAELAPTEPMPPLMDALWHDADEQWHEDKRRYRDRIDAYVHAIGRAAVLLGAGRALDTACRDFLALPESEVCYLLGGDGRQIGLNQWATRAPNDRLRAFEPLREAQGARWTRRPYFRRAVEAVGQVQVTRPYRTLHGGGLCVTVSAAYRDHAQQLQVICGDVRWDAEGA